MTVLTLAEFFVDACEEHGEALPVALEVTSKVCSRCFVEKVLEEFYKKKGGKFGVTAQCKCCVVEYQAEYDTKPEVKVKKAEYMVEYHAKPENRVRKVERNAKPEVKAKKAENAAEKYQANREEILAKKAEYDAKPEVKAKKVEYDAERNAKPETKEQRNKREKLRKATDPLYKLTCNIRSLIRYAFKNGGYSKDAKTADILGCTYEELMQHIESNFTPEMNWNNQGIYWDVDHFFPVSKAKTKEQILAFNHYTNLRPLESNLNQHVKRDNIPFTISTDGEIIPLLESDREYILSHFEELEEFKKYLYI